MNYYDMLRELPKLGYKVNRTYDGDLAVWRDRGGLAALVQMGAVVLYPSGSVCSYQEAFRILAALAVCE